MKVVVLREHREPKDLSRTIDIQRGVGTWAASQDFFYLSRPPLDSAVSRFGCSVLLTLHVVNFGHLDGLAL
jgi:hypothetical protein